MRPGPIVKSELYEDRAYLTTASGDVWQVNIDWDGLPSLSLLTDAEMAGLNYFRRRAEMTAKEKEDHLRRSVREHGFELMTTTDNVLSIERRT